MAQLLRLYYQRSSQKKVYKATIIIDGIQKTVAVKVMHPNVKERVELDMQLIKIFGRLLEYVPGMQYLGPSKEIDTFCGMMIQQLDLRIEASNLERFRDNFNDVRGITFPKPFLSMCGENLLVEEFREGILLSDWLMRGQTLYDGEIAKTGLNAFMVLRIYFNL